MVGRWKFLLTRSLFRGELLVSGSVSPTVWHSWVDDDFPAFPFGGICDPFPGRYFSIQIDTEDSKRPSKKAARKTGRLYRHRTVSLPTFRCIVFAKWWNSSKISPTFFLEDIPDHPPWMYLYEMGSLCFIKWPFPYPFHKMTRHIPPGLFQGGSQTLHQLSPTWGGLCGQNHGGWDGLESQLIHLPMVKSCVLFGDGRCLPPLINRNPFHGAL